MLVSKVPLAVQATLVPMLTQLPLSLANMICTNVPGPQMPLYLLGHKLLRCYPYVPIGGEMGVNVAILSYNGVAYIGFGGDVSAVPDIECFEDLLRESFAELSRAATKPGVSGADEEKPARKRAKPRPIPVAASKPAKAKPRMRKIPVVSPARKKSGRKTIPFSAETQPIGVAAETPQAVLAQTGD
jgi:diacylglycerol O-acyltransferase / wax synthase